MENVVDLRLNYDDSGVVKIQEKQLDLIQRQQRYHKQLQDAINATFQEAVQSEAKYTEAIKENLSQLKSQDLQIKKTSKAAELYERAVDKITDSLGQFKERAIVAINGLKDYGNGLINSIRATAGFTKALNVLKLALIGTGIGAVILALTALVAVFTRTQAGANKISQAMAGLGAAVDVVVGKLVVLGEKLINVSGEFKKYYDLVGVLIPQLNTIQLGFIGVGFSMSKAAKEGAAIEKGYQELSKRTRELTVDQAESEKTLARLTLASNNEALSAKARIAATRAASAETQRIIGKEIAIERDRLKLIQLQIASKKESGVGSNDVLEENRANALARIKSLQADLITQQGEYKAGVLGISQAEQDRIKKLQDAYNGLLGDLEKRLDKASITGEDGIEKLIAQRDVAIQELVNFQKSLEDAAQKAGVQLPEATKQQITSLYAEVEDEFVRQAIEFRKKNPFDVVGQLIPLADKEKARDIEAIIKENTQRAALAAVDASVKARPLFQKIKDGLLDAFNINEEELALVADLVGNSISQIDDIIFAGTQRQIEENNALIASIEKRVSAAQEAYNTELKLQEDGFANNAKLKEEELRAEQARLQRAQEQKEALEKKALRQQLISDSLAQASQLALAAAKVIGSESSKGLVGIITAASGIALLFRIIAQARANAVKFSAPQKFRKGGELLKGPSHEDGGIPIIIGGSRIVEAEGGEMVISRKNTAPNIRFLDNLNKGQYQGVDLLTVAEQAKRGGFTAQGFGRMASNGAQVSRRLIEHESRVKKDDSTVKEVKRLRKTVEVLLEELKERPVITPLGESYKKEYKQGKTKVVEVIKSKNG